MYKNILLAYDGSVLDQKALIECQELANWGSAQITLLTVTPNYYASLGIDGGFVTQEKIDQDEQAQLEILNAGVMTLKSAGYQVKGVCLKGDAAVEIANYAKQNHSDLIVVGHKHQSHWAARWWGSSKSKALIEIAHCSVLIVILKDDL
ncbi:MAG: universal stress protein [Alcaligenaceae bacterium]|nr:MAG: universal stress protein [Alcaligenaceae bacterium]